MAASIEIYATRQDPTGLVVHAYIELAGSLVKPQDVGLGDPEKRPVRPADTASAGGRVVGEQVRVKKHDDAHAAGGTRGDVAG